MFVTGDVEFQRASKREVENLKAFANRENRQTAGERLINGSKLPLIANRIDILLEDGRIGNRLLQKLGRNVGAASQQKTVDIRDRNVTLQRIANFDFRVFREKWTEPFFILLADPGGKFKHQMKN